MPPQNWFPSNTTWGRTFPRLTSIAHCVCAIQKLIGARKVLAHLLTLNFFACAPDALLTSVGSWPNCLCIGMQSAQWTKSLLHTTPGCAGPQHTHHITFLPHRKEAAPAPFHAAAYVSEALLFERCSGFACKLFLFDRSSCILANCSEHVNSSFSDLSFIQFERRSWLECMEEIIPTLPVLLLTGWKFVHSQYSRFPFTHVVWKTTRWTNEWWVAMSIFCVTNFTTVIRRLLVLWSSHFMYRDCQRLKHNSWQYCNGGLFERQSSGGVNCSCSDDSSDHTF